MKRILILEDNVKTLTSLEKMIREISPEIITFKDKMVDYLKKALIYGHTSRISS